MVKRWSPYLTPPDMVTLTVEAKMAEHPQGRYVLAADYKARDGLMQELAFVAQETVLRLERDVCEYDDIRSLLEIARAALEKFSSQSDAAGKQ